jgi:uncharacterized membrane protein YdjX (TVP38/TMEM64 family)
MLGVRLIFVSFRSPPARSQPVGALDPGGSCDVKPPSRVVVGKYLEVSSSYCDARAGSTPESGVSAKLSQTTHAVSPGLSRALRRAEAVATLVASFALAAYVVSHRHWVEHVLAQIGPFAMPLAIVVFAVVASAPFSVTDALAIMNGVLFGPFWGSVVNAVGLVLAAIIGYLIALRTSVAFDVKKNVERLPPWARRFKIGSPMFLIVVRVIPGLGGTIATQTAAALRVPIFRQVYTMCAIAIPICTVLAVFGYAASDYIDAQFDKAQTFAEKHHIRLPHRRHHPRPSPPGEVRTAAPVSP